MPIRLAVHNIIYYMWLFKISHQEILYWCNIMITWMRLVFLFIIVILLLQYVKEWGCSIETPQQQQQQQISAVFTMFWSMI